MRSNLTFEQRTALKELSQRAENKVYFYNMDKGFVIPNKKDTIHKIEEQIGESLVSDTDLTSVFTSIIQKHLWALGKQQKFEIRTYFQLCSSNPLSPRLYGVGVINTHKPKKCYPM